MHPMRSGHATIVREKGVGETVSEYVYGIVKQGSDVQSKRPNLRVQINNRRENSVRQLYRRGLESGAGCPRWRAIPLAKR